MRTAISASSVVVVWSSLVITLIFGQAESGDPQSSWRETDWSAYLAKQVNGKAEHTLPCGSRVDILEGDVAWEVEWCHKWPEAIGQSVYYGLSTGRKPGVWLLKQGSGDDEDYVQCLMVCRHLGIELQVKEVK